jgi:hypothetical protein
MQIHDKVPTKDVAGFVHIIVRDAVTKEIVWQNIDQNIIKIFAKESFSHSIVPANLWDPIGNTWVPNGLDLELYRPRYIVFGAAFDDNLLPISGVDTRYYQPDSINGGFSPIQLTPGATNNGGLINAVPIASPTHPLKRVERVYFEPSYQPAGTPLLYDDVRAINNVVVFQTTLQANEYNGLTTTSGDFLTLTEVALVAAPEQPLVGVCECDPQTIFLTGDSGGLAFDSLAASGSTITLAPTVVNVNDIQEGDQVKIVAQGSTPDTTATLNQPNPYYLVVNKATGGHDITLDRTPVDVNNVPLTGNIGVLRDTFRMFSHRILSSPVKKSQDFEIDIRWLITLA